MITTLGGGPTIVHLTYNMDEGSDTPEWRIACMPHVTDFATAAHHHNYLRSNDTRATNCQACAATAVFKRIKARER